MNDKKSQLQNDKFLLYIGFNSPSYLDLFNQLIVDYSEVEKDICVLNPPSYTEIQNGFGKLLVNLFRLTSPYDFWLRDIDKNDKVVIYNFQEFYNSKTDTLLEKEWNEFTKSKEFLQSLRSTLISELSSSNPELEYSYNKKKKKAIALAKKIFIHTSNVLIANGSITHLLVPNGRFLDQFVFAQTPKILGKNHIEINYYERGLKPNTYFAGEFSLLDRVKYQEMILKKYSGDTAADWFENRVIEPAANEYSGLWTKTELNLKTTHSGETPNLTIFSSSPDEFAFLGPDWHESEWIDQWEAYEAVINKFSKTHDITIRLHPNTINKSYLERKRMRKSVEYLENIFPNLKVISASSSVNSYELIRQSAIVAVWYSTIGLEAVNMGVPVICLNSSEWDLVIDVNKVFSKKSLEAIKTPLKPPDMHSATKFISGRIALDLPIKARTVQESPLRIDLSHQTFNQKVSENMRASDTLKPRHILNALYQCGIWYVFVRFVPRKLKNSMKKTYRILKARLLDTKRP
jgi:hypothetical protein